MSLFKHAGLEEVDFEGMKAECIAMFWIVYIGGWTVKNLTLDVDGKWVAVDGQLGVATVHLLAYSLFVWTSQKISGALFNPALTLSLMFFGRLGMVRGLFYIVSQLFGSFLAGSLLIFITNLNRSSSQTITYTPSQTVGYKISEYPLVAGIYEMFGTFLVVLMHYLSVVAGIKGIGRNQGLIVGSAYFFASIVYGQQGGSANISRMFGPLVLSNQWLLLLVCTVGSLVGGGLGAILCETVIIKDLVKFQAKNELLETPGEPTAVEELLETKENKPAMPVSVEMIKSDQKEVEDEIEHL